MEKNIENAQLRQFVINYIYSFLWNTDFDILDVNSQMVEACKIGNYKEKLQTLIYKGADCWNKGLFQACCNNYDSIIN